MELYAAWDAIDHHMDDEELVIISDSQYLVNAVNEMWYAEWIANRWRNARGKRIENQDIWRPLTNLVIAHGWVSFEWVRGHTNVYGNVMADKLANEVVSLAIGSG